MKVIVAVISNSSLTASVLLRTLKSFCCRDEHAGLKPIVGFCLSGANITGVIPGFNTTVLLKLPRSMLLIQVESVLMGFAFLAMIIVRSHLQLVGQRIKL